jgi:hemerythrin
MKITAPKRQYSANPTGNSQTDSQHDALSLCIEKLLDAKNRLPVTLCAVILYQHVREHFAREEKLMRKLQYPAIEAHVNHHYELISQLNAVVSKMAIRAEINASLESFIFELTQTHFGTHDKQLAIFMSHKETVLQQETED